MAVYQEIRFTNTTLYYCTIQDAIDDPLTQNGDIITVSAGTYAEHVIINKSVEPRDLIMGSTAMQFRTRGINCA